MKLAYLIFSLTMGLTGNWLWADGGDLDQDNVPSVAEGTSGATKNALAGKCTTCNQPNTVKATDNQDSDKQTAGDVMGTSDTPDTTGTKK